ncbi:MAG: ATP-binding protein [Bacteroidales bacterium]
MKSRIAYLLAIVSLLFAIGLFALIPFTEDVLTSRLAQPPNLTQATEVIKERTEKGMDITKMLINESIEHGSEEAFALLNSSFYSELNKNGLAVFIFKDNNLEFWSEKRDVDHILEYSDRLVLVQNTWCISYWIARDNYKGLLLVELKYNYPYQNKFLENKFHSTLSFLEGYGISPSSKNGSFPLSIYSSRPVFYLNYIPKNFDSQIENLNALLYRAGFIFVMLTVFFTFWIPSVKSRGGISVLLLAILVGAIRILTLQLQLIPQGDWQLFGPEIFAYSWLSPSLGDSLFNSILVFLLAWYAYRVFKKSGYEKRTVRFIVAGILAVFSFLGLFITDKLISILVLNSTVTLEAYRIFDLSVYSILEYLSLSLWFASSILLMHASYSLLPWDRPKHVLFFMGSTFLLVLLFFSILFGFPSVFGVVLAFIVFFTLGVLSLQNRLIRANIYVIFAFLLSVYTVTLVSNYAVEKDNEIRKILAINLANERDPVAEVMFPQMARKMYADEDIVYYLDNIFEMERDLNVHLNDNYLGGYFKKYDFQTTVCFTSSMLTLEKSSEVVRCYDFFEDMLNEYGFRIPGTSFYHLNNQNGRISYLGMIEFVLPDGEEICIYIELDSKLNRELLGYPELLLDGDLAKKSTFANYSSAKYHEDWLIARTGDFSYPLVNQMSSDTAGRYTFIEDDQYSHMMYEDGGDITLFLSRPKVNLFDITASFAWVFLFFFLTLLLLLRLGGFPVSLNLHIPSFKNRIRYSMVQVLLLSLIMVGMVTIVYSVKSFENKNTDSLSEKMHSVMVDVESNLINQDELDAQNQEFLTHYLINLSNIFYSDINLYDVSGELIATSRPEVFERQLFGTIMHPIAWYQMDKKHSPKLIHKEKIGNMEYLSAYAPLFNAQNQKIGYLNLPYFTRQGEFMNEVLSVIVALVNIYALLILFAVFVAVAISNRISKPLELIREKLSTVDIDKHNETISYEGRDEVGKLVNEYNRMVIELAESARKIAYSQRQSAWREMAKQIAHEIKNPLTPIKLNLQYLVRAKKASQPGWQDMFDKFADSLVDQINALSNIATEFSNFAKMPAGNFQNVSLTKIIDDAITLFSAYPNISIEKDYDLNNALTVHADREQLHRVFVNLLKNAIQAIGRDVEGRIVVSISSLNSRNALVCVADNGGGIHPEVEGKLFSPNFTTKSSGMGLGLAISKGIVEVMGGDIWFETEYGVGTKFCVKLPVSAQKSS